ncbi:ATP-binding protein [Thermoactinomyces sp. DSM 45892]|uniref:ATP-binding protein n=1 Tax=Thermoactinomyces sp. DSM 45892 TaxID=1882753 RepID=UPI00089C3316|nr:ATP-binding protein [Thermoactinomyces sp. DSM 45892]SDY82899.1 AAA-like domain-containing protein [Thermoactinomyces sp. DSM 45892]
MKSPTLFRSGNMIITKERTGQCFFEIPQENYSFLSDEEKFGLRNHVAAFKNEFPYTITWIQVPVPYSSRESVEFDLSNVPEPLRETAKDVMDETETYIQEKIPTKYNLYLSVNMEPVAGGWLQELGRGTYEVIRDPIVLIDDFMGGDHYRLPWTEWKRFESAEYEIYEWIRQKLHGQARRLTEQEVVWLTERSASRGYNPSLQESESELITENGFVYGSYIDMDQGLHDVDLTFNRPIGMIHWSKDTPDGLKKGYFSMMAVSSLPSEIEFPGSEVYNKIRELDFEVDLLIREEPIPVREAKSELKKKLELILGQVKHTFRNKYDELEGTEDLEGDLLKREVNKELQKKITSEKIPIFKTQIIFVVWADTPKEVQRRRRDLREKMSEIDLRVEIPRTSQKVLYHDTLPGAMSIEKHYIVRTTGQFLSSFMPLATTEVGDPSGIYIGNTVMNIPGTSENSLGRAPVFLNVKRARDELSMTSSSVYAGSLGAGKSMLTGSIVYYELLRGVHQLLLQPKDELWAWPYELKELAPITNIVSISNSVRDKGKFDPLTRVPDDPEERMKAKKIATSLLLFMAEEKPKTWAGQAIQGAIDLAMNHEQPSMLRVLDNIELFVNRKETFGLNYELAQGEVERMYSFLRRQATETQAQLFFGDGTEEPIDVSAPLTIIQMQNLGVPDPGREDYRLNMSLFIAITDFARRFVNQRGNVARSVLFEELHAINQSHEGQQVLRELVRTCRSKNADLKMVVHNLRDLRIGSEHKADGEDGGEEIRSNIGYRFVFRMRDDAEAKKACELLGIEPSDENVNQILNLRTGEWLMADLDRRVSKVSLDLDELNPRLFRSLDTRPVANERREREFGHMRSITTSTVLIGG